MRMGKGKRANGLDSAWGTGDICGFTPELDLEFSD